VCAVVLVRLVFVLNASIDVVSEEESEEAPDAEEDEEDESSVRFLKAYTKFLTRIMFSLANLRKNPQSHCSDLSLFRSTFQIHFVKSLIHRSYRRGRDTIAERDAIALEAEEIEKRKQETAEERKKQSHDLVAESIRRELLESASFCICNDCYAHIP
jgi:microfibrillar-associated protein 1